MSNPPRLGPVSLCTLIARDGTALVRGYCEYLYQQVVDQGPISDATAAAIGYPELVGHPSWTLANQVGRQWLHIVEYSQAQPREALHSYGWLAMETLVEDVDALAAQLAESPFELLRPPADLDVSDKIRACQARGPAGEVLYLTQIRGEAPPFELPTCSAPVDHLFIPVLSSPSREQSLAQYSDISGNQGLSFDTKITVVNQARGFDMDRRHPVATLQLAGNCLIEIDQIADTVTSPDTIYEGMASVAFSCSGVPPENLTPLQCGPFNGHGVAGRIGAAGERYSLIYPDRTSS